MMAARVVLPSPGGPDSSTWSRASPRIPAAFIKTLQVVNQLSLTKRNRPGAGGRTVFARKPVLYQMDSVTGCSRQCGFSDVVFT